MKKAMMLLMGLSALDTATAQTPFAGELIVNGNFSTNCSHPEMCLSSDPNLVRGWTPEP